MSITKMTQHKYLGKLDFGPVGIQIWIQSHI